MDESAHHALANAGGREIVGKKEGEQKGSARGSVHWGYSDAQYSQRGRQGIGVVVTDTLTNTSYMCGGEVPDDILAWVDSFCSRKKQKIIQLECSIQ